MNQHASGFVADVISHDTRSRGSSDALKQSILRLYDEGRTDRAIADDLGVEKRFVRNMINRNRDVFAFRQAPAKRRNGVDEGDIGIPRSAPLAASETVADARDRPEHDGGGDGKPVRFSRASMVPDAAALWARGLTMGQIAAELGVNKGVISGLVDRNRKHFPRRKERTFTLVPADIPAPEWGERAAAADDYLSVSDLPDHDVSVPVRMKGAKPWRLKEVATADLGLSLLDLDSQCCKWPISDRPYAFCGGPVVAGRSYCQGHLRLAYRPLETKSGSGR